MNTPYLTIAYMTGREDCRIEWFFKSLARETGANLKGIALVVVDLCAEREGRRDEIRQSFRRWFPNQLSHLHHSLPKPSVWQGASRLTTADYHAMSCVRNTALCLAPDGWIAFTDDLSVLMPGYLDGVRRAMAGNYVVAGAYKKVLCLEYEGDVPTYLEEPKGIDTRWLIGCDTDVVPIGGGQLYGYAAGPVEAFLSVNGYDEDNDCTGMGGEDYCCGLMLEKYGWPLRYDRRMWAIESAELHHKPGNFLKRVIEHEPHKLDATHVMLDMILSKGRHKAPNYFPGGIKAERARVLAGQPFSPANNPQHSWYSGKPLNQL